MKIRIDAESQGFGGALRGPLEDEFILNPERNIFGVVDGFGSEGKSGAIAAKLAQQGVLEFLEREVGDRDATLPFVLKRSFSFAGNILFNGLANANRKVRTSNLKVKPSQRGGASAVVAFFDGALMILGSVGNCEAWLLREGRVSPLVLPRSQDRLIAGGLTSHAHFNRIPLVGLGLFEDLEPEIHEYRVQVGDRILLGSGGLLLEDLEALQSDAIGQGLSVLAQNQRSLRLSAMVLRVV